MNSQISPITALSQHQTPRSAPARFRGHAHPYALLTAGALAAALTLTACGPNDGSATAATAMTNPAALQPQYPAQPMGVAQAPMTPVPAAPTTQAYAQPAPAYVQPAPAYVKPAPAYAQPAPAVRTAQAEPAPRQVASATLGEVRAIEPIRTRPQGSGAGAVVGGVLGAVLGNQIGHGGGRAAATVLGGVGGAVAGNNVERNHNEGVSGYRVRVQFDNGSERTYEESRVGDLRVGDRVRIEGGQVRRV